MTEDNTILVVAVLAVIASLAAAGFSYYSLSQGPAISGFATEYGYTNLSITQTANLNFTTNFIDFGSGVVNIGKTGTVMNSEGMYSSTNQTSFNNVTQPLVLENIGNTNVSLTLSSTVNTTFLGGTNPSYKLKVTDKASNLGSCGPNSLGSYTEVTGSAQGACGVFGFFDSHDEIEIDVQLYLPYDAPYGAHSATITAIGTGI